MNSKISLQESMFKRWGGNVTTSPKFLPGINDFKLPICLVQTNEVKDNANLSFYEVWNDRKKETQVFLSVLIILDFSFGVTVPKLC